MGFADFSKFHSSEHRARMLRAHRHGRASRDVFPRQSQLCRKPCAGTRRRMKKREEKWKKCVREERELLTIGYNVPSLTCRRINVRGLHRAKLRSEKFLNVGKLDLFF